MSPEQAREAPALELRGVTKRFGDVVAVDNVDFTLTRGTVHALIGENGAGKSTLMRIADGLIPADAGVARFYAAPSRAHDARAASRAGVGMVHQHLSLVPSLTVAENLVLGGRGLLQPAAAHALLRTTMESSGLRVPDHALDPARPPPPACVVETGRHDAPCHRAGEYECAPLQRHQPW